MNELNEAAFEYVEDARIVLETLGMDAERSNERSALVLLALLRLRALFMWVIWVSEVTLFVGHRLLHGRIGVANYPYLSKKQPMRY